MSKITKSNSDLNKDIGIDDNATSTAITINASQNVGIGETTNINSTLTVGNSDGSAVITSGGTNTHLSMKAMGSGGALIFGAGGVANGTAGTERMRIDSAGNVKVGDSSTDVTSKLTVSGNASKDVATFMYDGSAGTYLDIDCNAANGVVELRADARTGAYPPLTFKTGNTERMRIDSAGIVTMPYQPAFKAFRTTGNFTYTSGFLLIPINSTAASGAGFNTGNNYSTSTQRFTAPVSGVYNFSGSVNYYGVSSGYIFSATIWVNGSSAKGFFGTRFYSGGTGDLGASVTGDLYLSAGDYVDLRGYTDDTSGGGSGSASGNWNYFSGHLIG